MPRAHQTDCLSAAIQKIVHPEDFTQRYGALLRHYGLEGRKTPASPHENGDVEQRHFRFRGAVDQTLMLRGHRDFENREAYATFLRRVLEQLNAGRKTRLSEELAVLRRLPQQKLDICKRLRVSVGSSSTIRVAARTYSVHSRLVGEHVEVRLYAEHIDVYYAQRRIERLPRLRGKKRHLIQYAARSELADPQAGRVRELPLSVRPVSDQPLPEGLRPSRGATSASTRPRVVSPPSGTSCARRRGQG